MGDAGIILAVGLGHHLGYALLHGVEGDNEVVFIPVGEGYEGVGGGHILLLQKFLVGAVAADDRGLGQYLAEMAAAVQTALNDLYVYAKPLQNGGEVVCDSSAAHQKYVAAPGIVPPQQAKEGGQAGRLADQIEPVPHLGHKGTVGDDHISLRPLGGTEPHREGLELAALGGQGMSHQKVLLPHPEANQLHPTPAKGLQIGGRGKAKQTGDLRRRGVFRVDDQVDAQGLLQQGELHSIFYIAYPGDRILGAQPLGGQAADHVDLIHTGGGDQHIRSIHTRLSQGGNGRAVAFDTHDIQGLRGVAESGVVGVNYGDIVLLLREVLGEGKAHLAVAHDDDFQAPYILSERPEVPHNTLHANLNAILTRMQGHYA